MNFRIGFLMVFFLTSGFVWGTSEEIEAEVQKLKSMTPQQRAAKRPNKDQLKKYCSEGFESSTKTCTLHECSIIDAKNAEDLTLYKDNLEAIASSSHLQIALDEAKDVLVSNASSAEKAQARINIENLSADMAKPYLGLEKYFEKCTDVTGRIDIRLADQARFLQAKGASVKGQSPVSAKSITTK
ncbi:MAG: hypothetical protein KBD63_07450 [Bacteriovoracaceae bacterium]|nr:hypothetical protein [Bacteriovoracaceae bacterium]